MPALSPTEDCSRSSETREGWSERGLLVSTSQQPLMRAKIVLVRRRKRGGGKVEKEGGEGGKSPDKENTEHKAPRTFL